MTNRFWLESHLISVLPIAIIIIAGNVMSIERGCRALPTSQLRHSFWLDLPNYGWGWLSKSEDFPGEKPGTPGGIWTPDLWIRSPLVYSTTRLLPVCLWCVRKWLNLLNYGYDWLNGRQSQKTKFPGEKRIFQSAEGRTRTGTLDNQRGILSPLRRFQ